MNIPTKEQLAVLYPNIDSEYILDYINRQLILIELEESKVDEVDVILSSYMQKIIGSTNDFAQSANRDFYYEQDSLRKEVFLGEIDKIVQELRIVLCDFQIDSIIQTHETSANLYKWILEKYFVDDEVYKEVGGEQKKVQTSVKKKNMNKAKAEQIVGKKISKKTVGQAIDDILGQFKDEMGRMYDSWTATKTPLSSVIRQTKNAFKNATKSIKDVTRHSTQQTVYDAQNDVEITVSDDYEIVYYRIEVLDSSICMLCLNIDGSVNEKPLGLMHKNCRGIDILLLRDEDGKYYDTNHRGYGHKMKTQSFEKKFAKLSKKQQRRMLGKANYEYYQSGKLKADDFISYDRAITKVEAENKMALNKLKSKIQTPTIATNISRQLEHGFPSIDEMDSKQLLAYEKVLGYQKQLYNLVPKRNFGKKTLQEYIEDIDAKHALVQARRNNL